MRVVIFEEKWPVNDFEATVLKHIRTYPGLGAYNIQRALDVPKGRLDWALNCLFREGHVRWEDVPHPGPNHFKRIWYASGE